MDTLLKNPVWLIGAAVLGLFIFLGRKSGGADSRLGAAIESQRIASEANVALSGITAGRDVGMAKALNDRAAIAAGYQINFAEALTTLRALAFAHDEAMRSSAVAEKLGALQVTAARDVALSDQASKVKLASIAAASRDAEISAAGRIAELSGGLARDRLNAELQILQSPEVMAHVERLAGLDVDRAKALATISSQTTQAVAQITGGVQRYLSDAASRAYRSRAETDIGGSLISDVIGGITGALSEGSIFDTLAGVFAI